MAFERAICRIEIADRSDAEPMPVHVARLWLFDEGGPVAHRLVSPEGEPIEIRGRTEPEALRSAITFLQSRYGALSAEAHACIDFGRPPRLGAPVLIG